MDDAQLDRSIRFAAFLIGAVLFLVFGVEDLVSGAINVAVECGSTTNYGQSCSGSQLWQILAPVIGGVIVTAFGIVFLVLAYRIRRPITAFPPPPP
jgi:hypothetical protein